MEKCVKTLIRFLYRGLILSPGVEFLLNPVSDLKEDIA